MASDALKSVGVSFEREDPITTTFTRLAEVKSVSGPNQTADTIEVTNLDSTSGYREFIASFKDGGEVALDMNFTVATYTITQGDFNAGIALNYKIIIPDATGTPIKQLSFAGIQTGQSWNASTDDAISADITIKVTGPVTFEDTPVV